MKLGCGAWVYSSPHYQPPYDEAIRIIGDMGFDAVELISFEEKDLYEYYTADTIKQLRDLYESYGMILSEFAVYTPVVADLAHMDPERRERAFEIFKRGVQVGKDLGSQAINLVSNWVQDVQCPMEYPPCYITPFVNGVGKSSPKLKMEIPDIDYDKLWDNYMDMLKRCLDCCVENGMDFYIEGHSYVIVGNTDAMLRMYDNIMSPHLGINFDTAWHLTQREFLPLSIKKLGNKIRHFHLRDGDGMFSYSLPCGAGVIDWEGVIKALKDIKFDGVLSFEMGGYADTEDTKKYIQESKEYIQRILDAAE